MKYEFSEQTQKNLLLFLDRVEAKGIIENQAFSEIIYILNNPIQENQTIKEGEN